MWAGIRRWDSRSLRFIAVAVVAFVAVFVGLYLGLRGTSNATTDADRIAHLETTLASDLDKGDVVGACSLTTQPVQCAAALSAMNSAELRSLATQAREDAGKPIVVAYGGTAVQPSNFSGGPNHFRKIDNTWKIVLTP